MKLGRLPNSKAIVKRAKTATALASSIKKHRSLLRPYLVILSCGKQLTQQQSADAEHLAVLIESEIAQLEDLGFSVQASLAVVKAAPLSRKPKGAKRKGQVRSKAKRYNGGSGVYRLTNRIRNWK